MSNYVTLFDFLGKAAGSELGLQVAETAKNGNVPSYHKPVSHSGYHGAVKAYPIDFLEDFFKEKNVIDFFSQDEITIGNYVYGKDELLNKVDQIIWGNTLTRMLLLDSMKQPELQSPLRQNNTVVLSLSGGMDSGTLLLNCALNFKKVVAVSFDYGQKHKLELNKARNLVSDLNNHFELLGYPDYRIEHHVIKLEGLSNLLSSSLVTGGAEVPEGHYADETMKETVVPNRNKIFSSIIQSVALSEYKKSKEKVLIAMGIHSGDHAIYPDCTPEFRDADLEAFKKGNWDSEFVDFYTPYIDTDKEGILKDGVRMLKSIGLGYEDFYFETMTSYKPINIGKDGEEIYVSDYKSSSSVERVEAFVNCGLKDPIPYADENGLVDWEDVVIHVKSIIKNK